MSATFPGGGARPSPRRSVSVRRRAEERRRAGSVSTGMDERAHDTPSEINAEDGEVLVDGPDGVAFSFTPDAAIETSERLFEGGLAAQGQRVEKRKGSGKPATE